MRVDEEEEAEGREDGEAEEEEDALGYGGGVPGREGGAVEMQDLVVEFGAERGGDEGREGGARRGVGRGDHGRDLWGEGGEW